MPTLDLLFSRSGRGSHSAGCEGMMRRATTWAAVDQPLTVCNTDGPSEDKLTSTHFTSQFIPEAGDLDPFRMKDSMLHDSNVFLQISSTCRKIEFVPAIYRNYPRSIHSDLMNAAHAKSRTSSSTQFSRTFKTMMGLRSRTWREAPINPVQECGIKLKITGGLSDDSTGAKIHALTL